MDNDISGRTTENETGETIQSKLNINNIEMFDRQIRIWGEKGQELIQKSYLIIIGADRLGLECAKSAAILGVGNIVLIDNKNYVPDKFLDFDITNTRVKSIAEIIKTALNDGCNVEGLEAGLSELLLTPYAEKGDCTIIDVSNTPAKQALCYSFGKKYGIPVIVGAADKIQGSISGYFPITHHGEMHDNSSIVKCLDQYKGKEQGIIMSNILAGILIEQYRKALFWKYERIFHEVRLCKKNGELKKNGEDITYYNEFLENDYMPTKNLYYTINGDYQGNLFKNQNLEDQLRGKKALILGCGAIGNYLADMLARLDLERVDVVDLDKFVRHNKNRTPLAHDGEGRTKSVHIAEKINKISGRDISSAIIGFVGEDLDERLLRKSGLNKNDITILNAEWFESNKGEYNIIFGAFDNIEARYMTHKYAVRFGLNYIDGGSGGPIPNQCRAAIYVPRLTNCMKCNPNVTLTDGYVTFVKEMREQNETMLRKAYYENREVFEQHINTTRGYQCGEYNHGSINMVNQMIAGFMVGAARIIFDKKIGELVETISFNGQRDRIGVAKNEVECRCHMAKNEVEYRC